MTLSSSSLPDAQSSSIPATPPSNENAIQEGTSIYSNFILQSPSRKAIESHKIASKEIQDVTSSNVPKQSINWRAPTFSSRQTASQHEISSAQDDQDISDEDEPLTVLPSASMNWRRPMQNLIKENQKAINSTQDSHSLVQEDTELTRLEDTDGSEMDYDDEEMDEFEMQDYLKHRLKTGLNHLDERLGQEYLHAAQDDEHFSSHQGGLSSGGLLEISGTPGSGKTTFLIQVAVKERLNSLIQFAATLHEADERLSDEDKNLTLGRQVVIIDTEGSISAKRIAQMAIALIAESLENWEEWQGWTEKPSQDILFHHTSAGIHIIRCTALFELLATFEVLLPATGAPIIHSEDHNCAEEYVKKNEEIDQMRKTKQLPEKTSLIVIDSMSHFFRAPTTSDKQERTKRQHAFMCARTFASRAHYCGIKLIISTQMSSYFVDMRGEKSNVIKADNVGFLRPTLRDWMEEEIAQEAWHVQLCGAELGSSRKIARITSRPTSLLNHHLYGEEYWTAQLPYVIGIRDGIMRNV